MVMSVRDAMMKNLIGVQKAVAKKLAPKSQHRSVTSYAVTRKTMNILDADMEGLGCQFITGGDEDKSHNSADNSLHIDDEKENLTSESEM